MSQTHSFQKLVLLSGHLIIKIQCFFWSFVQIVEHLADLESPWNCPHGRPTMRHLVDLTSLLTLPDDNNDDDDDDGADISLS